MKDQTYFLKNWLTDPDFKNWLANTNDNTAARCRVCHKTFKLSNSGRPVVKVIKKHFDIKLFFFELKNSEQLKACSHRSQNSTPIEIEKDEPTFINHLLSSLW